jgi:hypothetical protein
MDSSWPLIDSKLWLSISDVLGIRKACKRSNFIPETWRFIKVSVYIMFTQRVPDLRASTKLQSDITVARVTNAFSTVNQGHSWTSVQCAQAAENLSTQPNERRTTNWTHTDVYSPWNRHKHRLDDQHVCGIGWKQETPFRLWSVGRTEGTDAAALRYILISLT